MKTLEQFKTEILIEKVKSTYQDDSLYELRHNTEMKIKYDFFTSEERPFNIYVELAYKIIKQKMVLKLCRELLKKGKITDEHYAEYFTESIKTARQVLVKLRPKVLEETKKWDKEKKVNLLNNEDLGPYFKDWFINNQ